jgi:TPR repeat protein
MEYVEEDPCCICLEKLPKNEITIQWAPCCGKGYHVECVKNFFSSTMTNEQKSKCPHCQTKLSTSPEEEFKRTLVWAEKGKAIAQKMLGDVYREGHGVDQSYEKAVEYYTMAAEQGYANAQYNVGVMYELGQGVEQSYEKAVKYYTMAVEQGDASAQFNLGRMYKNGEGVEQSYEKAVGYYTMAAEQGDAKAQYNFGVMYYIGEGVEQSYEKAVEQINMKICISY